MMAGRQLSSSVLRWLLPLLTPLTMFGLDALVTDSYRNHVLQKGATAPFTMRADSDAVFDLHETRAAEAAEAKQAYIPIYNKDKELFYAARTMVLDAALARPIESWYWPPSVETAGEVEAGGHDARVVAPSGLDAGQAARRSAEPRWDGVAEEEAAVDSDGSAGDSRDAALGGPAAAGPGADGALGDAGTVTSDEATAEQRAAERQRELTALVRGYFGLLEPFFKRGVVADTEFPHEKRTIRLFVDERYLSRAVSQLHRFSELRPALRRGARQFFFKSDARLRAQVVEFVLQRLPANVSYAQENERFIADISQVTGLKVVLIRRGAVLAGRGDTIDTRAHYAIRASVASARETSWLERRLGRYGLVGALLLLLGLAGRFLCPAAFERVRSLLFVHGAILVLFVGAKLVLLRWPVHASLIPHVAVALIAAVVLGRAAAVLVAIAVTTCLAFALHFDLTGIVVGAAGGVTAALIVRPRRRLAVLSAGVLVGLTQALALEACRAASGHSQETAQLWASGQAFVGGLLCGPVALVGLPFVQRWLGQASRGSLDMLADFNHLLLRRLRERQPDVFAHSVRVMNLADAAAKVVGADRLLTRVGALLHDIGKLEPAADPRDHVRVGTQLARQHRLPHEVLAFIGQHHGTLPVEVGASPGAAPGRFAAELPSTIEVTAVMFANRVARATRLDPERPASELVEQIMLELIQRRQLVRCPVSTAQLDRMAAALVSYLDEHRVGGLSGSPRSAAPPH